MIFSAALPTMYAHAQTNQVNSDDARKSLQQCIQQFQGSDHIYCAQFYTTNVVRSGTLNQYFLQGSLANSIVVYENTKVTLSGLKSTDPDAGQRLSYHWDQISGDKITFSPSSDAAVISFISPAVPANEVKSLKLALTVNDGYGGTDTTTFTIVVLHVNHPPVVTVNPDQVVDEGTLVSLKGTATDADNDPLELSWGQYSGPSVQLASNDNTVTSFIAPQVTPGKTAVMLFVFAADDGHGGKAAAMTRVTVKSTHQNPTVSCQDISVNANSLVRLPVAVANPSGDIISYYWRQVSGQPVQLSSNTVMNPTFVAPTSTGQTTSTLRFILDVTDNRVDVPSCSVTVQVNQLQVTGQPPVADAGPDQTVSPNSRVVLDGSASTGVGIKYKWVQVSGDPVTLILSGTVHPVFYSPSVDYTHSKVLEFKLTVSNQFGTDTSTVKITATLGNEEPTARINVVP
jgi:large repetitive protein